MQNLKRECPQCRESIEGRPNKKFCSDACKGRYFRENGPQSETNTFSTDLLRFVDSESSQYYNVNSISAIENPMEDYQQRYRREEQERQEKRAKEEAERSVKATKEKALVLHQRFCSVVREFLETEGKVLRARNVDRLLQQVDKLTEDYQAHPYLKLAGNQVRSRLKKLYTIHDKLEIVAQEIADKLLWQSEESHYEITNKLRKGLRELLIPD